MRFDKRFEVRRKFLRHNAALYALCEILDHLIRKGINHAEFQNACLGQRLLHIFVNAAGTDNAQFLRSPFHAVDGKMFRIRGEFFDPIFHHDVFFLGVRRHHHVFCDVLFIRLVGDLRPVFQFDEALRMRNARRQPQNNRRIVFFGNLKRQHGKILGFLTVGWFDDGAFRADRRQARILFVLRTENGRVVRNGDNEPRVHAGIYGGKQRIGGDIQTDVFHGNDGPRPLQRRTERDFERHLFVGRPFAVHVVIPREFLRDFRRRRAGISSRHLYAAFVRAARDGEISEQ